MVERLISRRPSGGPVDRPRRGGAMPAGLVGLVGAIGGAAVTLSSGGGVLLALLAYACGGSIGMMGFAALGALETPVVARLRAPVRAFRGDGFARRARVG